MEVEVKVVMEVVKVVQVVVVPPDVVQGVYGGAEAAVQAEDLAVHQRGQRQVVEQVGEVPADLCKIYSWIYFMD